MSEAIAVLKQYDATVVVTYFGSVLLVSWFGWRLGLRTASRRSLGCWQQGLAGILAAAGASVVFHPIHLMVVIGGFLDTGSLWRLVEAVLFTGLMGAVAALPLGVVYGLRRALQNRGRVV